MTRIPFAKAHGARNDFLLTWAHEAPQSGLVEAAVALMDRHAGVGGDGWLLVSPPRDGEPAAIRLFNADGSEAEISGNGTRCAAAFLVDSGLGAEEILIRTGAGVKELHLLERKGLWFLFEMNMGEVKTVEIRHPLKLRAETREATLIDPGNPQCALFVEDFEFDWKALGAEIEVHSAFPKRTNVSFIRVVDGETLDVRFFERGAGFTMSSGTGSTGAFAAARARGLVGDKVTVQTLAGDLALRWEDGVVRMQGPAEIVAGGEYYWNPAV
jgi:diaminopimelate epimerase